ncbi:MraW methylase family-domain-containing protein [Pavlovales sp. CCMP2436]|nr:MraW methylase family-domain-containing protein [Pavlovales sp. CCMP2436]
MVVGLLSAAVDFILPLGTTHGARRLLAPLRRAPHARAIYSASVGADVLVSLDVGEESAPVHVRRKRYSNTYPKKFEDKYKEHRGDAETILKVLCKGSTPAGQHVPIMPAEIMERLSLASRMAASAGELVVVDCTVGYGGHSSEILAEMMRAQSRLGQSGGSLAPRARLVCLDQDVTELRKTERRLSALLAPTAAGGAAVAQIDAAAAAVAARERRRCQLALLPSPPECVPSPPGSMSGGGGEGQPAPPRAAGTPEGQPAPLTLSCHHCNFESLGSLAASLGLAGRVSATVADLGFSSMQVDDPSRGFSHKALGFLDMRMDATQIDTPTAHALLESVSLPRLVEILQENADETLAEYIAPALLGLRPWGHRGGSEGAHSAEQLRSVPGTTVELAQRVKRVCLAAAKRERRPEPDRKVASCAARTMQALRIEVNGEFAALEALLDVLPAVLAPGGVAVFLTFHSGEDRRVKKAFKKGFQDGVYSEWSREVVRAGGDERFRNPRSKCAKLRWAIRKPHN